MGLLLQGRRYTYIDYTAALSLVLSIVFFALGNRDTPHPQGHAGPGDHGGSDQGDHSDVNTSLALLGVALITVATFFDAFYANFVEKFFFRKANPSSRSEVVAYTGLVSMLYTFVAVVLRGELSPGMAFFTSNRAASVTLLFASLMGYLSLNCNVLVTKLYDCTRTEVVKSSRKIATVIISFIVYPKPLNMQYFFGVLCLIASVYVKHNSAGGGQLSEKKEDSPGLPMSTSMVSMKRTKAVESKADGNKCAPSPGWGVAFGRRGDNSIKGV